MRIRHHARTTLALVGTALAIVALIPSETFAYDPLQVATERVGKVEDFTVDDLERDREIPIRVYWKESDGPQPVVLFSHGLGGSREGCGYLGKHWSSRGYVAVFLQHPGSDDSVWRDQPVRNRMAAMQRAASGKNFSLRVADVSAVLDQLAVWNESQDHPLASTIDLDRVGMSGHSFGAVTTQAVSGQSFGRLGQRFTDDRIRAAIAFSPSVPRVGDAETAFSDVAIPWLLMTGTKDTAPIGNQTVESRLQVFPNLSTSIDRYQLVLEGAQHSAFTDRSLRGETGGRNPNHHKAILAVSTAFWDTYLRQDATANQWLRNEVRTVLDSEDRWQAKLAE